VRLAVTVLGLDLFTLDLTTNEPAVDYDDAGDCTTYPITPGFVLAERDGGTPENVD